MTVNGSRIASVTDRPAIAKALPVTLSVDEAFRKAGAEWTQGRFDQVIAICQAITRKVPGHADAFNLLGLALFARERKDEALAAIEAALAIADRADFHNNVALVHKSLGAFDPALSGYLRAVALKPDYAEAHANLGRLLLQAGNQGGALVHLKRAVALNGNQPNPHDDLASIAFDRGDLPACDDHLTAGMLQELSMLKGIPDLPAAKSATNDIPFEAALSAVAQVLDDAGLPFFLGDGTALGFVRDGGFISFDKDIDLGMASGVSRRRVMEVFQQAAEFWIEDTIDADRADLMIPVSYRNSVAIDLFFYHQYDRAVVHGLARGPHRILWRQTPFGLRDVTFGGRRYSLPDPADRYLAELYGDTWRDPDPDYCAFVTGDIVDRLPLLARVRALYALQSSIRAGRRQRVLKIAAQLRERLEETRDAPLREALARLIRLPASKLDETHAS